MMSEDEVANLIWYETEIEALNKSDNEYRNDRRARVKFGRSIVRKIP